MHSIQIRRAFRTCALPLVAAVIAAAPPATAAERVTCSPTKVTAIISETDRSTTSMTLVPLTETTVNFVQGGSRPSCVMVRLEGYVAAGTNTAISISATIDGNPIDPGEVQLAYNDSGVYQPRAWTFVIPSVAPGAHRVGFKFRSNNGNSVSFNDSNVIVHYVP